MPYMASNGNSRSTIAISFVPAIGTFRLIYAIPFLAITNAAVGSLGCRQGMCCVSGQDICCASGDAADATSNSSIPSTTPRGRHQQRRPLETVAFIEMSDVTAYVCSKASTSPPR